MLHQQPPQYQYQQQGPPTLAITAHGAQNLIDVEAFGKQDPYVQFSLDFNNVKSFQKTFVHKNAGKNPVWNQSFNIPLQGEPELYLEIMDDEITTDAPIAFAAIPINQIVHAPGGSLNGIFDVYTPDGKQQGQIHLTLTAHNVPGQNMAYGGQGGAPVRGTSHISELHQRRMKSLKNKERMADVGTAALGGILAVGAGFLANKLVNDHNREEEARKAAERNAQQERERAEAERRRLEEERANFARTQSEEQARFQQQQAAFQQQQQQYQQQQHNQYQPQYQQPHQGGYEHHDRHNRHDSDSDSSSDSDDSCKKSKKGKKWQPYGWYSAGDKVKYDGRKYICLQGHNAQGDWAPTVAHSLWRCD
ncbi:hypothetical protein EMPS_09620 [Entomortierella parvispora]|uniref:C2 domain-containing protein n=1 Tax=Entomortierella parvispora TaxID=205924 RepID=A0A9P3M074_9FUNG|nr:hypothetical protein EMPS_09620 [Entomortierella parvispora]